MNEEQLPNPALEERIRIAALDRCNRAQSARCRFWVLMITLGLAAACAGAAFLIK